MSSSPCRLAPFAFVAVSLLLLAPAAAAQQRVACQDGFAQTGGQSYACSGVDLLGHLPITAMGGTSGTDANDIWGWTDPLTGREYALVGLSNGTSFVDVTDPSNPVYLGRLPAHSENSLWRDIKVYADHAFVVSEAWDHGMQIFDLTRLRDVANPPATFTADAHYDGIGTAHNIAINEETGYAYILGNRYGYHAGCASQHRMGHHVVDIRDPLNPEFVTCFSDEAQDANPYVGAGYTHDTQCVIYRGPDAEHVGKEICLAANEDVLTIFDVTDKADVQILSQAPYPQSAYTHQGWLTEDHRFFIANDEMDETHHGINTRTLIFDVSDLDEPEFQDFFLHPVGSIDHNLFVVGRYVFAANYTSGLRILDLQPLLDGTGSPEAVGHFDTFPSHDGKQYDGAWSNYPFFESGNVIVSDISNGLFILAPEMLGNPVGAENGAAPQAARLTAARPNPFSSQTQLAVAVEAAQDVRVEVYDLLGRRVASLFEGSLAAGEEREITFDGAGLPAGTYVIRAAGATFAETQRVSLVR